MQSLWLLQASRVGCNTGPREEEASREVQEVSREVQEIGREVQETDWRQECVAGLRVRRLLDKGRAWSQEGLVNLVKAPGRFSALHYSSGHIAGGTADTSTQEPGESAVVWSVWDNRVTTSFPVSGSVSCIRLHWPELLVCGHFDGSLSSHSVTGSASSPPGSLLQKFRLHTAPVLALDMARAEDLLVSGSADCSTKLWRLSSGQLLKTLADQSHWVLSVILSPAPAHRVDR